MCQIGEPVKPVTTVTPMRAAARAVSLSLSAARPGAPSGGPAPPTPGGGGRPWRGGGGARGVLELVGGAPADAFGVAVAPHVGRERALMTGVDRIADRLADEVVADREHVQVVALEQLAALAAVGLVRERGVDVEVVA